MFQSSVSPQIGIGVVGELFLEGPLVAQPARIESTAAADNVVGRAFTVVSGATASWGSADPTNPAPLVAEAGGDGVFAGILANPKVYAGLGTVAGGSLAPTLTLPNGTMGELVTETPGILVALPAAAAVGDSVFYLTAGTIGGLVTTAPGAVAPANSAGPIGRVERYALTGAGTAVISVGPNIAIPAAA